MTTPDADNAPRPEQNQLEEHRFEEGEEAPPRGVRAMAVVRWVLLAAMVIAAFAALYGYVAPLFGQAPPAEQQGPKYHCPMHPQITSDVPGECPICHMTLEPIPADKQRGPAPDAGSATAHSPPAPPGDMKAAPPGSGGEAPAPPGTMPITLELDRVQAIGVRTALVERRAVSGALRVAASVEAAEQSRAEVHTRAEGFVEALHVRETGVKVKAGQVLASVYSPEIFQAQQELLAMSAWAEPGTVGAAPAPAVPIEAARKRLGLLGLGGATIDRILATRTPIRAFGVASPIAGHVVQKNVVLGSRVMPESPLFEIADLTKVYIIASVYPRELAALHVGDRATFVTQALPGRAFEAKIDLLYPDVDPATRTARVRFQVDNEDLALRPGQIGTAELRTAAAADELTVPLDAIIDTGTSVYVFVAGEGGRFFPRSVELGAQIGERYVVRSGVREGERVVSGATFLVDAESRIQASFAGASALPPGAPPAAGAPPGPAPPSRCDADFERAKFPDKWEECRKCAVHRGMGTMEDDCIHAIPKPWK